jgi:hypothetical protein
MRSAPISNVVVYSALKYAFHKMYDRSKSLMPKAGK